MNDLPKWVKDLNARKLVDSYYAQNWNTLYPLTSYTQSSPDEEPYEYRPFGANAKGFPYNLSQFVGKNYGILPVTPYGNTLTFDMAKAAINGEHLGSDSLTDLIAISLSTSDYIGHTFGPNSVEEEDNFLRLDKELGDFLRFLDKQIGNGKYVVFLSADHGVPQAPAFLKEHKIPAGNLNDQGMADQLNGILKSKYNIDKLVIGILHNQVYLDRNTITSSLVDKGQVYNVIIDFLLRQPGISRAFALDALDTVTLSALIKNIVANGYFPSRSGDIQIISDPQWIEEFQKGGSTHGVWNPYDSHIPLVWYGWNIQPGKTNRKVFMTDIAPTIAAMLHIQMPNGSIGDVIEEVLKRRMVKKNTILVGLSNKKLFKKVGKNAYALV